MPLRVGAFIPLDTFNRLPDALDSPEFEALVMSVMQTKGNSHHATQALNLGENRYRFVLSAGWVHSLFVRDLLLEVSPEIAWYGDNDRYLGSRRLAQESSQALTTYLRYRITLPWQVHLGWQGNWDGSTRIDGVDQDNAAKNQRWLAGVTWNADARNQLILRWAQDYQIDNGFKLDREIALRWMLKW